MNTFESAESMYVAEQVVQQAPGPLIYTLGAGVQSLNQINDAGRYFGLWPGSTTPTSPWVLTSLGKNTYQDDANNTDYTGLVAILYCYNATTGDNFYTISSTLLSTYCTSYGYTQYAGPGYGFAASTPENGASAVNILQAFNSTTSINQFGSPTQINASALGSGWSINSTPVFYVLS